MMSPKSGGGGAGAWRPPLGGVGGGGVSLSLSPALVEPRFSTLQLEYGEYYFEDFSSICYTNLLGGAGDDAQQIKGWLRICSKSIVFDAVSKSVPIFRFKLQHLIDVQLLCSNNHLISDEFAALMFPKTHPSQRMKVLENLDIHEAIVLSTSGVVLIERNHPHKVVEFSRSTLKPLQSNDFDLNCGLFVFSFPFTKVVKVFGAISTLYQIATNPGDPKNKTDSFSMLQGMIDEHVKETSFNSSWLVDHRERTKLRNPVLASHISPLIKSPGWLQITNLRIYFQPLNNHGLEPVWKFDTAPITRIFRRRHTLRNVGLEIFFEESKGSDQSSHSLFLSFDNKIVRDEVLEALLEIKGGKTALGGSPSETAEMQKKWNKGEISNYQYLMFLNQQAGRSFNDLTQYPVFPWIIADYDSPSLDLANPSTFRDLSKPVGALNPDRLRNFQKRMNDMGRMSPELTFLYGTHYSTPGYVLYYLVRLFPEYMLCLQNGRFDEPDRLFNSVVETWRSCLSNPADVKELIPHFYGYMEPRRRAGDFLRNVQDLELGTRQNGKHVGDVDLPAWAESSEDFIEKCKKALESDYVSQNLHHWIDLIFGFKNSGEEALKADNLFYYLTYEGAVDIDSITNPNERASLELQINEFGQTPRQLFFAPHPQRFTDEEAIVETEPQTSSPNLPVLDLPLELELKIDRLSESPMRESSNNIDYESVFKNLTQSHSAELHRKPISGLIYLQGNEEAITVSQDSTLKVYSLKDKKVRRSANISKLALSSIAAVKQSFDDKRPCFVGSWDNNIYLYSMSFGNVSNTFRAHDDAVSALQLCEESNMLVSGSWDSTVKVWDVVPGSDFRKLPSTSFSDHDCAVKCIGVSTASNDRGNVVAAGSENGSIVLWDVRQKGVIREYEGAHSDEVTWIRFSPNGNSFVSCSLDGEFQLWNVSSSSPVLSKSLRSPLKQVEFLSSGIILVASERHGSVSLWGISSSAADLKHSLLTDKTVSCFDYSSNSDTVVIACGSNNASINFWK
jgi:factor associated with neutral sphingomyelinase activation